MAFAPAQCRDAAGGGRMRRHSDCHGRESETVVAIDPTRSTPLPAGPPTPPPEMALLQHAGFPGYVPDYKEDIERLKQDCLDTEEIASPYARLMPLQEFAPARGWPSTAPIHILCDCPRRTVNPSLDSSDWIRF